MSKSKNEIDDALLERQSSWIDVVQPTYLDNQLKRALSHFLSLVHAPLTRELRQLLVITPEDLLVGLFVQVLTRINVHAFLDKESQPANDSFLTELIIHKDCSNDVTD